MRRPSRRQLATLGPAIAVVLVVALAAAVLGPHPTYLLHRLLPLESGPAGAVGRHDSADEEEVALAQGHTTECVESSNRRSCYTARLQPPLLRLERIRGGPSRYRIDVLAAATVPPDLAADRLLATERRDVVAVPGARDADGWYSVRAAWQADTRRWQLHRIDPAGLRAYDPTQPPTGPLPPRPQLYAALAEGPYQDPADVKRPSTADTDWGQRGFRITHFYDTRDGKDVLVTASNATVGVLDTAIVAHDGDLRLLYGLVAGGHLRGDLVGLLSAPAKGSPEVVRRAWRLTGHGQLEPVPVEGLTCRRNPGAGVCVSSYDNLVSLRGKP